MANKTKQKRIRRQKRDLVIKRTEEGKVIVKERKRRKKKKAG